MRFRSITNYPIFILTIVSLLTISYLTISMLREIGSARNNDMEQNYMVNNKHLRYWAINNQLYLECIDCNDLVEIIVSNKSIEQFMLKRNNTYYGPLVVPEESSDIYIVMVGEKPLVLDHLIIYKGLENMRLNISKILPPSISLKPLDKDIIEIVESYAKPYKFYILKPVSMKHQVVVEENKTYRLEGNSLVEVNQSIRPVTIYNGSFSPENDLEQWFRINLEQYGELYEYRRYFLNLYLESMVAKNPTYVYTTRIVTVPNPMITVEIPLTNIVLNKSVLLNTSIVDQHLPIYIRDIYGNTYKAYVEASYTLLIDNGTSVERIGLGRKSFYSNSSQTIYLTNHVFMISGNYSFKLETRYTLTILFPRYYPLYISISRYIYGGEPNYVMFSSYTYDDLLITLDNTSTTYRPIRNETCVELTLYKNIYNPQIMVVVGNNTYIVYSLNISYNGLNPVEVIDIVKPKNIIYLKTYGDLEATREDTRIYLLNKTSDTACYGIYYQGSWNTLNVIIYPAIVSNNSIYVVKYNGYIYLLDNTTHITLYYNNTIHVFGIEASLYSFQVYGMYGYEYPTMNLDDQLNATYLVNITYADGFKEIILFNGSGYTLIHNMIIREVSIEITIDQSGVAVYSKQNGSFIATKLGGQVYAVKQVYETDSTGLRILVIKNSIDKNMMIVKSE